MGADLITFICKGPSKLPGKKRKEAVALAQGVIEAVREFVEKDDPTDKEKVQILQLTGMDLDDLWAVVEIAPLDAAKVVDDLYATWNESAFRDVNSRYYDDDEKIVVAGELSFGDEPEGGGYQSLKRACAVGLFDFFGIR